MTSQGPFQPHYVILCY